MQWNIWTTLILHFHSFRRIFVSFFHGFFFVGCLDFFSNMLPINHHTPLMILISCLTCAPQDSSSLLTTTWTSSCRMRRSLWRECSLGLWATSSSGIACYLFLFHSLIYLSLFFMNHLFYVGGWVVAFLLFLFFFRTKKKKNCLLFKKNSKHRCNNVLYVRGVSE